MKCFRCCSSERRGRGRMHQGGHAILTAVAVAVLGMASMAVPRPAYAMIYVGGGYSCEVTYYYVNGILDSVMLTYCTYTPMWPTDIPGPNPDGPHDVPWGPFQPGGGNPNPEPDPQDPCSTNSGLVATGDRARNNVTMLPPGGPGGDLPPGGGGGSGGSDGSSCGLEPPPGTVPVYNHPGISVSPNGKDVYSVRGDLSCGSPRAVRKTVAARALEVKPLLPAGSIVTIHLGATGHWQTQKFTYAGGGTGAPGFTAITSCS